MGKLLPWAGPEFWNNPTYKPTTKIGEVFWQDFLSTAKLLYAFHAMQEPRRVDYADATAWSLAMKQWGRSAPTIYSVFNKIRQDVHFELPYSENFIKPIDAMIDKQYKEMHRDFIK